MFNRSPSQTPRSFLPSLCALVVSLLFAPTVGADAPPTDAFFGAPDFHTARISPNGEWVAAIHERDGRQIILVRSLTGHEPKAISQFDDSDFRLKRLAWASDERLLVAGEFEWHGAAGGGVLATNLFAIDRDGGRLKNLGSRWPDQQRILRHDRVIHMLPDEPDHVLLTLKPAHRKLHDVYRLNIVTGRLTRVVRGKHGIDTWYADPQGVVRFGIGRDGDEVRVVARASEDAKFETIAEFDTREGDPDFRFVGFAQAPGTLLVAARRAHDADPEADRLAIFEYSIAEKRFGPLVIAHPEVDIAGDALRDPASGEVVAIRYWVDGEERHELDPEKSALHRSIDRALPGATNSIIDHSRDGNILLVRSVGPDRAPRTHTIVRDRNEIAELFVERPMLDGVALARPQPIHFAARDGVKIHGYLTRPIDAGDGPLPAVVIPHGESRGRDVPLFDPWVQFLASRGYAVLQVDPRGTSGYGAAYRIAGASGSGDPARSDIADGVKWMVAEGIAAADRVAIVGTGEGGNLALEASADAPTLFRCAASFEGVFELDGWDRDQEKARSAIHAAERIRIPVLLGDAEGDPRAPVKQSKRMARALDRVDRSVELVVYEEEPGAGSGASLFSGDLERFLAESMRAGATASDEFAPAAPSLD